MACIGHTIGSRTITGLSLLTLVLQNSGISFAVRLSRTQGHDYSSSMVLLLSDFMKLAICTTLLKLLPNPESAPVTAGSPNVYVAVPAILYTWQTQLLIYAAKDLDVIAYQVTNQLKILTTAVFSVLLLQRKLVLVQWISLLLLAVGTASVNVAKTDSRFSYEHFGLTAGLSAALLATFISGFAGVYVECLIKGSPSAGLCSCIFPKMTVQASLLKLNVDLSKYSALLAFVQVILFDWPNVSELHFFNGFNKFTWLVIFLSAVGGLVTAVVVKYTDSMIKSIAIDASIVLTCIVSLVLYHLKPTPTFTFGIALVISAVVLYSNATGDSSQDARLCAKVLFTVLALLFLLGSQSAVGLDVRVFRDPPPRFENLSSAE